MSYDEGPDNRISVVSNSRTAKCPVCEEAFEAKIVLWIISKKQHPSTPVNPYGVNTVKCPNGHELDGSAGYFFTFEGDGRYELSFVASTDHITKQVQERAGDVALEIDALIFGRLPENDASRVASLASWQGTGVVPQCTAILLSNDREDLRRQAEPMAKLISEDGADPEVAIRLIGDGNLAAAIDACDAVAACPPYNVPSYYWSDILSSRKRVLMERKAFLGAKADIADCTVQIDTKGTTASVGLNSFGNHEYTVHVRTNTDGTVWSGTFDRTGYRNPAHAVL